MSDSLFKSLKKLEHLVQTKSVNIGPDSISMDELMIKVNDVEAKIITVNKIKAYARGSYFNSFMVHILKPKEMDAKELDYNKVTIILDSKETGEIGMGEAFVKR